VKQDIRLSLLFCTASGESWTGAWDEATPSITHGMERTNRQNVGLNQLNISDAMCINQFT